MTTVFSWFEDIEPEEFRRATDVSYHGFVWGTRAALKRMVPRDRGTIVQVGSAMAYRGIPLQSPYCGAKHAIKGFQESLRTELRHKGSNVHLTIVQLPGVNTPQFDHCMCKLPDKPMPVAPIYQPEVAARVVWWSFIPFIAFAAATVMTLPFAVLMRIMPAEHHSAASGLFGFSRGAGALIGPLVAGMAIEILQHAGMLTSTHDYVVMWLAAGAFVLLRLPPLHTIAGRCEPSAAQEDPAPA